jgi:4-oxalocrotonate tautomerase
MPFLQMHMIEGRPQEKKKELIAELTETVCRVLEVDPGTVRVELVEVPPENWGVAGLPLSERDPPRA